MAFCKVCRCGVSMVATASQQLCLHPRHASLSCKQCTHTKGCCFRLQLLRAAVNKGRQPTLPEQAVIAHCRHPSSTVCNHHLLSTCHAVFVLLGIGRRSSMPRLLSSRTSRLRVLIKVYEDKSYDWILKGPPSSWYIKQVIFSASHDRMLTGGLPHLTTSVCRHFMYHIRLVTSLLMCLATA